MSNLVRVDTSLIKYNLINIPRFIVIHMTASYDKPDAKDFPSLWKYHLSLGWIDIGYHYVVEMDGEGIIIIAGRPENATGAHAKGFNDRSIGIAVAGNYDYGLPQIHVLFMLASLCREIQRKYTIYPENVVGHRETFEILDKERKNDIMAKCTWKSCPGKMFNMYDLRSHLLKDPEKNHVEENVLIKDFFRPRPELYMEVK